jgi:hypothetical protein
MVLWEFIKYMLEHGKINKTSHTHRPAECATRTAAAGKKKHIYGPPLPNTKHILHI